ncbi:nucleotidyltransferase-like protein [Halobacillus amylolyticus]|uniref:Nucleotidyltransferase-like protein n=1 Tax=Halobacillus amylolyticus TaxID=2932259 RepID=A0ABY4HEL3_9BACI|nr:nucleotidyltransferase-like protein [Halobacillus amylolyticus]UOR13314.1 nucleotidyltransferase-like protein [Halobacillus amylolyticus]
MEDLLRPIYQERASQANTMGVLILEKKKPNSPVTDNFDVILFIIVKDAKDPWYVKHYEFDDQSAAMHIVDEILLQKWIDTSSYRRAVEWVINGTVIFERNDYVTELKERLRSFPTRTRDLKKAIEFAKLIRSYSESKDLFESEQYLDAFSRMVHSLHYLARLAIIEKGFHPEVTVWNQVRRIEPEVYKLYQELIESKEETNKRVQLLILAVEHAISVRSRTSAKHLLLLIDSKEGPWSFGELKIHPEIQEYALDLSSMVEYLVDKGLIEVVQQETKGANIYHRMYQAAPLS